MTTYEYFNKWDKYDVEKELDKVDEDERREEHERAKSLISKQKAKVEKGALGTALADAEALEARARVAALKASRPSRKKKVGGSKLSKSNSEAPQDTQEVQDAEARARDLLQRAEAAKNKSAALKAALSTRDSARDLLREGRVSAEAALQRAEQALKSVIELEQNFPEFLETDDDITAMNEACEDPCCDPSMSRKQVHTPLPTQSELSKIGRMIHIDCHMIAGEAHMLLGQNAEATECLKEALLMDTENSSAWQMRGKAYSKIGIPLLADMHFTRASDIDGTDEDNTILLDENRGVLSVHLQRSEAEKFASNVAHLENYTDQAHLPDCLRFATAVRHEADVIFREGFYVTAIRKYRVVLAAISKAMQLMGLQNHNDFEATIDEKAPISIQKTHKACLFNIAACHWWLQKDYRAAISFCSAASLHCPTNVRLLYLKGLLEEASGNFEGALCNFNDALQCSTDPDQRRELCRKIDLTEYQKDQIGKYLGSGSTLIVAS